MIEDNDNCWGEIYLNINRGNLEIMAIGEHGRDIPWKYNRTVSIQEINEMEEDKPF